MKLPFKSILSIVLLIVWVIPNYASVKNVMQSTSTYHIVAYIETAEFEKFTLLEQELLQSPHKVLSVNYNYDSHELTIYYTELIRYDTLIQILNRYFGSVEITGGYYVK